MSTQQQRLTVYNTLMAEMKAQVLEIEKKLNGGKHPIQSSLSKIFEDVSWQFPFSPSVCDKLTDTNSIKIQNGCLEILRNQIKAFHELKEIFDSKELQESLKLKKTLHDKTEKILLIGLDTLKFYQTLTISASNNNGYAQLSEGDTSQQNIFKDANSAEEELTRRKLLQLFRILCRYQQDLFREFEDHSNLRKEKLNCIQNLKNIILTRKSTKERLNEFVLEVEKIKKLPTMKQHRTPLWQRFLGELISCLLLVPALYQLAMCKKNYNHLTIFKPKSENLLNCVDEIAKKPLPAYRVS